MPWQLILSIQIVIGYIVSSILLKKLADLPQKNRRIAWQFFFCALFSIIFVTFKITTGSTFHLSWLVLVAAGLGIFNALANYFYWRAMNISLSKTSLFGRYDDLMAMALGFIFLGEIKFLNPGLLIGISVCLGASFLFITQKSRTKDKHESNITLFKWLLMTNLIWGTTIFFMRYFAVNGLPMPEYLFGWYGGSFLGAWLLVRIDKKEMSNGKFSIKEIRDVAILSATLWATMLLNYWAMQLAPLTVLSPINFISRIIFPMLVDFLIFKETTALTRLEKFAFLLGLVGAVTIGLSF